MPVIPKTFTGERFEANPLDLFETDPRVALECTKLLKPFVADIYKDSDFYVLDVGCGKGVWGVAANEVFDYPMSWGIDIHNHLGKSPDIINPEPYDYLVIQDYLTYNPTDNNKNQYDLIIGNPPFSSKTNRHLAEDIVLHSLDLLTPNGYLGLLLKTEFVAATRRYENIFKNHAPLYQYSLCPRPHWNNKETTNTIDYSFFIWDKNENSETKLRWLNWRG